LGCRLATIPTLRAATRLRNSSTRRWT
jgi:hypothetical protein